MYGQTFDNMPLPENDSTKFVKVLNKYGKKFYSGFEFNGETKKSKIMNQVNISHQIGLKFDFFLQRALLKFCFSLFNKTLLVFFFPYVLLNQLEGE